VAQSQGANRNLAVQLDSVDYTATRALWGCFSFILFKVGWETCFRVR